MIKLKIDNKQVEVEQGASILDAATKLGIKIPTMCHLKGYSNHPSCMVCMVKDMDRGTLQPSCAFPAGEGMNISTTDTEVLEARKEALELLLSDHVGDCEAPCRVACPAFMDIPNMNRLIATNKLHDALQIVKEEIALPLVLGYVCSAPCENACRRKSIDGAISICQLKKHVALEDASKETVYYPVKANATNKNIAIVGAGVAGLSAAFHLTKLGHQVTVFEKEELAGGTLRNAYESLPKAVLDNELEILKEFGIEIKTNSLIDVSSYHQLNKSYDAILLANGNVNIEWSESVSLKLDVHGKGLFIDKETFETSQKGVFACGSVVRETKMAVQALSNGKQAAYNIHAFLEGEAVGGGRDFFNSKFGKITKDEFAAYQSEAKDNEAVVLESKLVNLTLEQAVQEAERCMHCDCRKASDCKLRTLGHEYSVKQKTYQTGERNNIKKQFTHKQIVYETEKCIRCGLCVDIAEAEKEELGLTFVGRGFDVRIGVPFNEDMSKTLNKVALKCAANCPTGALALKY